jgi:hypothetical protein
LYTAKQPAPHFAGGSPGIASYPCFLVPPGVSIVIICNGFQPEVSLSGRSVNRRMRCAMSRLEEIGCVVQLIFLCVAIVCLLAWYLDKSLIM